MLGCLLTIFLLLHCFALSLAYYTPWFAATRAPNNRTLYVVGGGIPNYMASLVPRPLFIIDNYNSSASAAHDAVAVAGASGAKSLSFPLEGNSLFVATESCVLEVTEDGWKVRAIAGSCTETGSRNGPLVFARFVSLVSISSVVDAGRFFIALLDSGRVDKGSNLLLADSWSVSEVCLLPGGTFDLSMSAAEGFREIAVLALSPLSAFLILGRNDGPEKVMFASALRWKTYTIFSLNSSVQSESSAMAENRFTACLLQYSANGFYTAYLVDADGSLWRMVIGAAFEKITNSIYKKSITEWNGESLAAFYFGKLLWGGPSTGLGVLDTLNSRLIDVHSGGDDFLFLASNHSGCIFPWQKLSLCEYGHLWMSQECVPSPPGGYVDSSTMSWIPCPVGTYNPLPMAASSLACKRCDAGTIAPFVASVVCSVCNDTHPLQSTSGSECLAACSTTADDGLFCKSCPPGSEPKPSCQPCAETFYSSSWDGPCLPCPPNFTSAEGATYCSIQCPPGSCSPDGLSSCLSSPNSAYMVYTIADFKNSADYLLSMSVCPNGTIFLGNDRGYLIIFQGEGGVGDGLIFSVDMAYLGVKTLNAMALSWDQSSLFVADTLEGLIARVSGTGSHMEILVPKSANIRPRSLCSVDVGGRLYVVDAKNDSLIWLAPEPVLLPWPGLLFVTPHESGRGVVCLVENSSERGLLYSIWHVECLVAGCVHNATLLSQVFKDYIVADVAIKPAWISRWKHGKTAICINSTIALISDEYDNNNVNNNISLKIADGYGGPIAASMIIQQKSFDYYYSDYYDSDNEFLFLLEAFSVQVVFSRSCECAPNFYKKARACVPCPPHSYSMAGARGCSACPSGEYMSLYGDCAVCPLTLWWRDNEIYGPCRRMQSSLSIAMQGVPLTLLEAQDLADTTNKNNYISLKYLDIISNATILLTGTDGDLAIPPPDIWIRGDLLGRLWSLQSRVTSEPFDPQRIAVLNHPGIWSLCSQIVSPGESCTCRHGALQLGYAKANVWGSARNEATMENLPGFSFTSVFVLRPDDNHTTAPILIQDGGGSISLLPQFPIGDMGVCLMGWPAQFNCSDPNYVWEFPSEIYPGGACLPCPPGTIAPTPSSVKCRPITYQNPLCKPGSFKTILQDYSYACRLCEGDSYSSTQGAIKCLRKRVLSCPLGFYVNDGGRTSENTCVPCVPCGESSIMIPFSVNPCPGNTRIQPYVCVAWLQSVPGFSVAVLNLGTSPSLRYIPCAGLPPFAVWGSGPQRDMCFFRCKFGVNELAVKEYAFYWALLSPENSVGLFAAGGNNLFPYAAWSQFSTSAIKAMSAVCTPCNTSLCPEGMWRPLWNDGCGPPCHISPSLCQGRTDGCVSICNVPENAAIQSYDTVDQEGRAVCLWRCNLGFVKLGETCGACNASLCQPGESYIGNDQCSPEMSLAQICPPCPATVRGGVLNLAASDRGKCSYTCLKDYFYPNPNPFLQSHQMACVQCAGTVTRCPAGYSVTCAVNPCKLCQTPDTLNGRAVMVSTSDSICRVQCMPGFHTVSILDRTVLADRESHDPSKILCEECSRRPFISCPVLSCGAGYQILQSSEACVPCKTSVEMGCPEGTYAPPCPGGRVTQKIGCLNCPVYDLLVAAAVQDFVPDKWPTRMFVSSFYGQQNVIITADNNVSKQQTNLGDCLTACVHGSVQVKTSANAITCVSCSVLLPTPPKTAPYSVYYSAWNASDGLRWWPASFDPPHLQKRPLDSRGNLRAESRAGLCWPCPPPAFGELSVGDPCFSIAAANNNNNNWLRPPSSEFLVNDNSNPAEFVWILNGNNSKTMRRLLTSASVQPSVNNNTPTALEQQKGIYSLAACKKGQYPVPPLARWCAMCPENHYCSGENRQPIRCGPFSSAPMGSTSSENCSCRPGFVLLVSSCVLEVPNFDFRCPLGFYKETDVFGTGRGGRPQSVCFPCPAGTREKYGRCHDCPLQSTSKEASKVCTCAASSPNLTKQGNDNAVMEVITTTGACPSGDCPQGSSLDFTDSKCKSCSQKRAVPIPSVFPFACSCGPGSYTHLSPVMKCLPCPRGKFSQFAGDAPCTPCPEGTITLLEGSTTLAACVKSNILDDDVVGVGGNRSNASASNT